MFKRMLTVLFFVLCIMLFGQSTLGFDTLPIVPSGDDYNQLAATPFRGNIPLCVEFTLWNLNPRSRVISWDFGDGTPVVYSSLLTQSHIYEEYGVYQAQVEIGTQVGRWEVTSYASTEIVVAPNSPPVVTLNANPLEGTAPLTVQFNIGVTDPEGDPFIITWDFGDGSRLQSDAYTVSHTYQTSGNFTATVQVRDTWFNYTTASKLITVNLNLPPDVTLAANPTRGAAPLYVNFTATASDPENDTLTYRWNFGDGTIITSGGRVESHCYNNPGNYTAVVTVTDTQNGSDSASQTIQVNPNHPPQVTINPSYSYAAGLPATANFTAIASDPDGDALSYYWYFGDGCYGPDESSVSHTYYNPGSYTVSVTVYDTRGATTSASARFVAYGYLSNFEYFGGTVQDTKIINNYYYVLFDHCLRIYNITNIQPQLIGTIYDANGYLDGFDIDSANNLLYLVGYGYPVRVYDISNPAAPFLKAASTTTYAANDITLNGNYAYVLGCFGDIYTLALNNGGAPSEVSRISLDRAPYSMVIQSNYAYICVGKTQGLRILNLQAPSTPTLAGSCNFSPSYQNATSHQVIVKGNYAYLLGDWELFIIDCTNMSQLTVNSQYFDHRVYDFKIRGNELFVSDRGTGYSAYSLSVPSSPVFKYRMNWVLDPPNTMYDIRLELKTGGYVYLQDIKFCAVFYGSDQF